MQYGMQIIIINNNNYSNIIIKLRLALFVIYTIIHYNLSTRATTALKESECSSPVCQIVKFDNRYWLIAAQKHGESQGLQLTIATIQYKYLW